MEEILMRLGDLEPGDRFMQSPDDTVYVLERIGRNGAVIVSPEKDRKHTFSQLPSLLVKVVYKADLSTLAEHEVIDDANVGATPTHTLTFPDGTLVSVYVDPAEGPTGAVVVLVDNSRRAVRVTLNGNAEVRLWADPDAVTTF